ncbi:MAG: hypothetical protein WBD99_06340 [Thermodesulfobacteriota bacterium]
MSWAHIHLILNHIPLIGVGFTILLFIIALIRNSKELINVSLIFTIIVALWTIPVYLTGEPAEEIVEELPGISENLIEQHEEMSEKAYIFLEVVGALALMTLIVKRHSQKLGGWLMSLTLIGLIVGGGMVAWTANLGGRINHPEVRSNAFNNQSISTQEKNEEDRD